MISLCRVLGGLLTKLCYEVNEVWSKYNNIKLITWFSSKTGTPIIEQLVIDGTCISKKSWLLLNIFYLCCVTLLTMVLGCLYHRLKVWILSETLQKNKKQTNKREQEYCMWVLSLICCIWLFFVIYTSIYIN